MNDWKFFISDEIIDYVTVLRDITLYKSDTKEFSTPYTLENMRDAAHKKLFQDKILPMCHLVENFTENDAYERTKEIFSNLDKVWAVYDATEFDWSSRCFVRFMSEYLQKFLLSTEVLYFIEGRTQFVHGIHI